MSDTLNRMVQHFANIRSNDATHRKRIWDKRREFRKLARRHIPLRGLRGMVTVNVGCGPLPLRFHSREEILVDPLMDTYMSMYPRKYFRSAVVVGRPIEDSGIRGGHVHLVYCKKTLEYIEDWKKALVEMYRILKRGGYMVLVYDAQQGDNINLNMLAKVDMRKHLESLGFGVLEFEKDSSSHTKILARKT